MHDAKQCSDKFICEEIVDGGFGNMFKGHVNRGTRKTIVVGSSVSSIHDYILLCKLNICNFIYKNCVISQIYTINVSK